MSAGEMICVKDGPPPLYMRGEDWLRRVKAGYEASGYVAEIVGGAQQMAVYANNETLEVGDE